MHLFRKLKSDKHRRCPFINEGIKEKMAKGDHAHKIARETGALEDWLYYRDYRNDTVKRVLREAEKEYVQTEVKRIRVLVNGGR